MQAYYITVTVGYCTYGYYADPSLLTVCAHNIMTMYRPTQSGSMPWASWGFARRAGASDSSSESEATVTVHVIESDFVCASNCRTLVRSVLAAVTVTVQ